MSLNCVVIGKAHPVQGLVCAHGYSDPEVHTLPVTTVFVALGAFETTVSFTLGEPENDTPVITSSGRLPPEWSSRLVRFIDWAMGHMMVEGNYRVNIDQNFPSAIGVGSSAAVYAALTMCIARLAGKSLPLRELSAIARYGSYSAAASIVGEVNMVNTAEIPSDNVAEVICPGNVFPYKLLILPVQGEKESAQIHEDMPRSPFYEIWLRRVRQLSTEVVESIRQFARNDGGVSNCQFGSKIEKYLFENFATISTGDQNLLPWSPGTVERLLLLRRIRQELGIQFFVSMNSGPAVFAYCYAEHRDLLKGAMESAGVECISSEIGGPASAQLVPMK